jgi:hypothetical protein
MASFVAYAVPAAQRHPCSYLRPCSIQASVDEDMPFKGCPYTFVSHLENHRLLLLSRKPCRPRSFYSLVFAIFYGTSVLPATSTTQGPV